MSDLEVNPPDEHEESPAIGGHMDSAERAPEQEAVETAKPTERKERFNLEAALQAIGAIEGVEGRLERAIELMERTIAQAGAPQFKAFWELRKHAMELFKENVAPALRPPLWDKYTQLTTEARRLKEILDEQSAFAAEQIEMAIKALEEELATFNDRLQASPLVGFETTSSALASRLIYYQTIQRELQLLNTEATRINSLRKELIRTEMRVGQKNKFFQRLSAAGDHVFPRRKELIKEISESFITDIDTFVNKHFQIANIEESLFFLREEIKALQTIAKALTLNTRSFTHTRTRLSECWEKVKHTEKERKKERNKKKAVFKQHFDQLTQKIADVEKQYQEAGLNVHEAQKQFDAIQGELRTTELGREELEAIRDRLQEALKPIRERQREEEAARRHQEKEREQAHHNRIASLRQRIDQLLHQHGDLSLDQVVAEREALQQELADKSISKMERQELEHLLKGVRDVVADKRSQALLKMSTSDQQALQQLREVLDERLTLRQEIKAQLEQYRKLLGGSGLGFEQAIQVNEQQRVEKERLENAERSIEEIEEKIADLEAQL